MKILLTFMLITFTSYASALTLPFQCKSVPTPSVNEFRAKGIVTVDSFNNVEGLVNVVVQKIDEEESMQVFEQIKINGTLVHYGKGDVNDSDVDQLILTSSNPYLKSMNLLIDDDAAMSSVVLSVDNFLYRANCERVR